MRCHEIVVPGFCDHIDLPRRKLSILGIEVARDNAEFRDRVKVGNNRRACIYIFFCVAPVHAEVVRRLPLSIHRNRAGVERPRWIENGRAHVLNGVGADCR